MAEHQIVDLAVEGSNPSSHPIRSATHAYWRMVACTICLVRLKTGAMLSAVLSLAGQLRKDGMDRGRQGIPRWRRSAGLLGLSTLVSSLAVIGSAVSVAATDPCSTNAPNPYSAGPYQNPLRGATVTPARID